ncbi:OmpA family protein [Dactylosporangium vinaceum]|uniref:OmpA family protein n=1 Tax=Dactylosporangium vinaceum TaxID=53362 RepID=A0ABV5M0H9_9ACTN|nr:OmpA family protein [Dactylosporangium vinaceum]UAB97401.1 OmpA family protein [Dactylosporangium vinaceum]
MKHPLQRWAIAGFVLIALLMPTAGCDASKAAQPAKPSAQDGGGGGDRPCPTDPAPVAIALGARANSAAPALPQAVHDQLERSMREGKAITVLRVDGAPSRVLAQSFTSEAKTKAKIKKDTDAFVAGMFAEFEKVRAKEPQADPLQALSLAGQAAGEGGTVVLVDSGLQTKEPLDFRNGLLSADPAEVVQFLKDNRQLPTLQGRNVLLGGLAATVAPQPALDQSSHDRVIELWRAIATAAGAACVSVFDGSSAAKAASGDLPPVAEVIPPAKPIFVPCGQTTLANDGWVGFKPDEAEFVNRDAARQELSKLADLMLKGRQHAELIGTTATDGTREGRLRLSVQRAEVVKSVLVELGVPADRITTGGVGNEWPGREPDIDGQGHLMPGPAARNRTVVVKLTCPSTR